MPFDGVGLADNKALQQMNEVIARLAMPTMWCKGAVRSHDGRYCIRGAVRAVGNAEMLEPHILMAIREIAGSKFGRIESFNDHPDTTHELVLAVLDRARGKVIAATPLVVLESSAV